METIHRLIPCPSYALSAMEGWLQDCAEEGLLLMEDGFFLGFASFERCEPKHVRYRLLPVQKNSEAPDDEQLRLCEKYGWEYVARRRDFYVFRSPDAEARELNTDGSVDAYAFNSVKKRRRSALCSSLFYLLVYPLLVTRFCPLLTFITMGSLWSLTAILWGISMVIRELRAFRYMKILQKALSEGEEVPASDRKRERTRYFAGTLLRTALVIFLVCGFFRIRSGNALPLEEYTDPLPFATIKDFAGEGSRDYTLELSNIGSSINTVEQRSDLLAPLAVNYNEHATVRTVGGQILNGGLCVDYIELRSPALAQEALRELYRINRHLRRFTPMEAPALDCDEVQAYMDDTHFPNLLLRKGNVVARVMFYQTGEYQLSVEQWGKIVCERLGRMSN